MSHLPHCGYPRVPICMCDFPPAEAKDGGRKAPQSAPHPGDLGNVVTLRHDPLCPWGPDDHCECRLIAKARQDERQRLMPAWWSQEYHAGYRQGYDDAKAAVRGES